MSCGIRTLEAASFLELTLLQSQGLSCHLALVGWEACHWFFSCWTTLAASVQCICRHDKWTSHTSKFQHVLIVWHGNWKLKPAHCWSAGKLEGGQGGHKFHWQGYRIVSVIGGLVDSFEWLFNDLRMFAVCLFGCAVPLQFVECNVFALKLVDVLDLLIVEVPRWESQEEMPKTIQDHPSHIQSLICLAQHHVWAVLRSKSANSWIHVDHESVIPPLYIIKHSNYLSVVTICHTCWIFWFRRWLSKVPFVWCNSKV